MIDDSAAIEEIVAEAIPSIWGDERAVRAFVSQNRSLAQKVRDFIVDFVERLKQYAVDYAVDQDRTEILALQSREQDAVGTLEQIARTFDLALESAREKAENGNGTAHSLRKDNEIDLSNREYAMFREKIAEIKIGKSAQFPKSANGEYILAIDNKLVYTDGEFVDTHVSRIIELNVGDETLTDLARSFVYEEEGKGKSYAEIRGILESCFGEGSAKFYTLSDGRRDARQNGRGKERNIKKVRKDDHGDLSSAEKRKFSLKNESADKVDVDQTLRAGDNSVAGQTETNEQTRHEPVTVTETMRQWADKRAGQIIREYRSTIDADSVKADVARLVNELAENGASSDALNATVNMAKGIIEKSSRLDSALRDQYKDLRKNMRETAITLTDTQKQEAANITGSYGRYRQSLMGSFKLVSEGGTPLDTMWTEWSGQYPELFTPGLNEGDMVSRLAEIKTMFEPKYVNEYGEHLDAAAADLGMRLYSEALKQVGDKARAQQVTQSLNGMRSRYSKAMREALRQVKSDQVARFQRIANELQAARTAGDRAQFEDAAAWRTPRERRDESEILHRHIPRRRQEYHCRDAGAQRPGMVEIQRQLRDRHGREHEEHHHGHAGHGARSHRRKAGRACRHGGRSGLGVHMAGCEA